MTPRGERAVFAALPELSGDLLRESWFEAEDIGATFERTGARFPSFKALLTRSAHGQAVVMLSTPYWAMHDWPKHKEQDMFRDRLSLLPMADGVANIELRGPVFRFPHGLGVRGRERVAQNAALRAQRAASSWRGSPWAGVWGGER